MRTEGSSFIAGPDQFATSDLVVGVHHPVVAHAFAMLGAPPASPDDEVGPNGPVLLEVPISVFDALLAQTAYHSTDLGGLRPALCVPKLDAIERAMVLALEPLAALPHDFPTDAWALVDVFSVVLASRDDFQYSAADLVPCEPDPVTRVAVGNMSSIQLREALSALTSDADGDPPALVARLMDVISAKTIVQLREDLSERGLLTAGSKPELAARLAGSFLVVAPPEPVALVSDANT